MNRVNALVLQVDAAGNRTSERVNQLVTGASYNNVNQLTSQSGGGSVRFQGRVNKPVTNLTVAGTVALVVSNPAQTNLISVSNQQSMWSVTSGTQRIGWWPWKIPLPATSDR